MAEDTQVTQEPVEAQITIADLQNTLRIIDAAAERGAFKGNELSSVGIIRDKLAGFLDSVSIPDTTEDVAGQGES